MFYHLIGELVLTEPGTVVIDCGGIGYRLSVSSNTLARLTAQKDKSSDKKVRLLTHLQVRNDPLGLFGFYDQEELSAFRLLISVSGVGVKSAMSMMSALTPEKFALAVITNDTKALSKAPGIGAKTAARIVLDLKDKISKELTASDDSNDTEIGIQGNKHSDAINTLLVLGYSRAEAMQALRGLDTAEIGLEDIIKAALKKLMKG